METLHSKKIVGTPFRVETSTVENTPGTWNSTKVAIFRDERLIGEYIRNYSSFGFETFYPFQVETDWYALYSAKYTATRVMKLHDDKIEDWCGEDDVSHGFCPVEFYIPRYIHTHRNFTMKDKNTGTDKIHEYESYTVDCNKDETEFLADMNAPEFVSMQYCNFGFLCGCHWGDDSSWKIRYIDLSKIPEKSLLITDKFGYWEMPESLSLKQCVNMNAWEPGHDWIALIRSEHFNLKTDERC